MINPIRLYTGTKENYVMIQGYVRSVTESKKGNYNSVSFLVDSNKRGPRARLISVMCFDNDTGINFKKLTEHTKGRFVTFFAEERIYEGKTSYKAIAISIAPKVFMEETNPIDDDEVQPSCCKATEEYEQLTFDFYGCDLPFSPIKSGLTSADTCAKV